ncbi:MAG: ATP-dependent DNA helicase [Actinomycetaceae bacterium]|nr:ATP-dependent DNA helicase [Actinomycetaceae bacterium]
MSVKSVNNEMECVGIEDLGVRDFLDDVIAELGGSPREGQRIMVDCVEYALVHGENALIQAGTGTGKSLGYLVPSILWAKKNDTRVVVSTATLALQRQIMVKDAPLVSRVLRERTGQRAVVSLLKGWSNYGCRAKIYEKNYDDALFSKDTARFGATKIGTEVKRLRGWLKKSKTGDRDDVPFSFSSEAWAQVSISKQECRGRLCSEYEDCFARKARSSASRSDVVVTNHAVLALETVGNSLIPSKDAYVIDEAHELVDRVTQQLTVELSADVIARTYKQLDSCGVMIADMGDVADDMKIILRDMPEGVVKELPYELHDSLLMLKGYLVEAFKLIENLPDEKKKEKEKKAKAKLYAEVLYDAVVPFLGEKAEDNEVRWIEERKGVPFLCSTPVDVATILKNGIFSETPSILTSATLKLGGSFDAIAARIGFAFPDSRVWKAVDVPSPFDPRRQGICYIASHLPEPAKGIISDDVLDEIVRLMKASSGGAMGLFTSWTSARRAHEYVSKRIDTPILLQGEAPTASLVKEFRDDPSVSLFGTRSLWQGIDVPGLTNRLVIVDKIPFPPPNDPLVRARTDLARTRGENAFFSVSVFSAALQLAQGVGRLVRSVDDRGVVALLDSRIAYKGYGKFLLNSLPNFWRTEDRELVEGSLRNLAQAAMEECFKEE